MNFSLGRCLVAVFGVVGIVAAPLTARGDEQETPAAPRNVDVVILKDGTFLEGAIARIEPGKFVVLRDAAGVEQTLSWDLVSRVQRRSGANDSSSVTTRTSERGLEVAGSLDEAEARRQAWVRRGGTIVGYGFSANGSLLYQASVPYTKIERGTARLSHADSFGVGVGGGLHISILGLSAPDTATSKTTWSAWRLGTGVDFSYFTISPPGDTQFSISATQVSIPVSAGGQIGTGTFRLGDTWHGVMLGADYRPTFTYFSTNGQSDSNFNWAGFQITADVTSFKAAIDARAAQAQFRFTFLVLPPLGETKILFVTLGLGAVWY